MNGPADSCTALRRYIKTRSTQAAAVLTPGPQVRPTATMTLDSPLITAAGERITTEQKYPLFPLARGLGLVIGFFGTGTAGKTITSYLWGAYSMARPNGERPEDLFWLVPLYKFVATLGTGVGVASSLIVSDAEKIAKSIAITPLDDSTTPQGVSIHASTAFADGTHDDYSPGVSDAGGKGLAFIANVGRADAVILEQVALEAGATDGGWLIGTRPV